MQDNKKTEEYGICYKCHEEAVIDENFTCNNCQPREEEV